jgi:hypothetical protein
MKHWRQRDVFEAAACIGGAWRRTELLELMEPEVSTKCQRLSKRSELVRTGWNLSRVTSACDVPIELVNSVERSGSTYGCLFSI